METMNAGRLECKNCNNLFEGNYCNYCGQKSGEVRFTTSNLLKEFIHGFFHVQGGLWFTIKELFVNPGEMLRGFISGKRVKYINPFTYLVIISLAGSYVYNVSGIFDHSNEIRFVSDATLKFTGMHLSYRILLTIPTYAIISFVIYKSYKYNLAEHFIINTYMISQSMFFLILWMLVSILIKPENETFNILYKCALLTYLLYQLLVLYHLFNSGKVIIRSLRAVVTVTGGLGFGVIVMNYLVKFINMF